jgi:hypothetical protein
MESREECLREATECERLAELANTRATRVLFAATAFQWRKLAEANTRATRVLFAATAFQWRKLAEKAMERQKAQWPSL